MRIDHVLFTVPVPRSSINRTLLAIGRPTQNIRPRLAVAPARFPAAPVPAHRPPQSRISCCDLIHRQDLPLIGFHFHLASARHPLPSHDNRIAFPYCRQDDAAGPLRPGPRLKIAILTLFAVSHWRRGLASVGWADVDRDLSHRRMPCDCRIGGRAWQAQPLDGTSTHSAPARP